MFHNAIRIFDSRHVTFNARTVGRDVDWTMTDARDDCMTTVTEHLTVSKFPRPDGRHPATARQAPSGFGFHSTVWLPRCRLETAQRRCNPRRCLMSSLRRPSTAFLSRRLLEASSSTSTPDRRTNSPVSQSESEVAIDTHMCTVSSASPSPHPSPLRMRLPLARHRKTDVVNAAQAENA